jgi:hypothetical protein
MYIAVVLILGISAAAFAVTNNVLKLHYQKIAVPLLKPLTTVSPDLGPWHQIAPDQTIAADMREMLGTKEYVFRDYVDERVVDAKLLEEIRTRNPGGNLSAEIAATHPQALVQMGVTYYTGRVDAVIHLPERCNVAGGVASTVESVPAQWIVNGQPLDVRVVRLEPDAHGSNSSRYLAYYFIVNGREENAAWRVRRSLLDVFERYAWFAKIEVVTPASDPKVSATVLSDFLGFAIPEIQSCLPPSAAQKQSTTMDHSAIQPLPANQ